MPLPKPDTPLGIHCSTLFNSTLYTFSPTAFQSVSLSEGAEWETLPVGVSTSGAECVHAHRNTPQEALYIVGGTTSDASSVPETGFKGLQRWLFNEKKWETIDLPAAITYNLTNHGATFLESSQQIIVFSGTIWPDTTTPSANTYLIKTTAPFEITAVPAADPLLAPLVLPWGSNGALVVGGNENNRGLKVFSPDSGWMPLTMSLEKGLPVKGKAGVSLMDGDDGSRMLYTFDLTTGPTAVAQLLVKEPGAPSRVRRQETAAPSTSSTRLTVSTWPSYDSELAPKLTMDGISVAYEGDVVVISPADDANPMAVFDARKNSWMNTTELFEMTTTDEDGNLSTLSLDPATSSTSVLPTGTSDASSTESPTAAAAATKSSGLSTVQLLFIILGSIIGLVLLLAVALILLKRRRKQLQQYGGQGTRRMSFQDRGASFMQEAEGPIPPRFPRSAIDSWASKDIEKPYLGSTTSFDNNGPTVTAIGGVGVISSGRGTPNPPPGDRNISTRSSGWSKYFSGAEATNLVTLPQRSYSGNHSAHSSTYTDLSTTFPTIKSHSREGQIHPNPYLHNAGVGVAAGGIGVASAGVMDGYGGSGGLQRSGSKGLMLQDPGVGVHSPSGQRRGSKDSVSSMGASSYSSGIPESLLDEERKLGTWSPVDGRNAWEGRGPVASSVYPDSPSLQVPGLAFNRRDTGPDVRPGQSVDNLSWLDLRR